MGTKEKLKQLLVEELNLEDLAPADIEDGAPLFKEGLGLDSLDAVEIVMLLKKHFGIELKSIEEAKPAFVSVDSLAAFIDARATA